MGIRSIKVPFGVFSLALAVSCSKPLDESAYRRYVQDPSHGLTQQLTDERVVATCTYRPTDLQVAQELKAMSLSSPPVNVVDSLRHRYSDRAYFALSLAQDGAEIENQWVTDQNAYARAIAYLNTGIAQDVFLVTSARDSVAALAATYPRQYGNTGRSTILLVFDASKADLHQNFHISLHDQHFGLGPLQFFFQGADLAALPSLNF
jgi:hypothetical protein